MTPTPARRAAAFSMALALPLALLSAAPAAAETVGVTTWSDLQDAFQVDGDTVRLDANITADVSESLVIEPGDNITLDLNGFALEITSPASSNAAIAVPPLSSLTINATNGGTLTAIGGGDAAGIGGGVGGDGGTTIINGGTITATGGGFGAGIGGGNSGGDSGGDGGTTIINGGTITATGALNGAGIGGGYFGDGGTTIINGGTITATGGASAAGIGGGTNGDDGGTTTINGGTTTATGGNSAAGIGGGANGVGGTTVINGGTITATGGFLASGIGGGRFGSPGALEVNGTVNGGGATDGGGPNASPITNPTTPVGVGYTATTSTVDSGGRLDLRFNYLITFTANGGSSSAAQTVDDGDPLTEPAPPTREGFTFAGWTVGGSAYDFSAPVTEPLELTATWTELADETTPPDETPVQEQTPEPENSAPSGDPAELANTGADVTTTLSVALLFFAAGVALVALRRRELEHTR